MTDSEAIRSIFCPSCGTSTTPDPKFCVSCGGQMNGGQPTAVPKLATTDAAGRGDVELTITPFNTARFRWLILAVVVIGIVCYGLVSRQDVGSAQSGSNVVTMADYGAIQKGMSYEQVRAIIGTDWVEISRADLAGYNTVMYSWQNSNGSTMIATFQNGELITKAQIGLP